MRKIFILIVLMTAISYGQFTTIGESIGKDNGSHFLASDEDSVYFEDDTLFIWGSDTAFFFINVGHTEGQLIYKGYVFAETADSAYAHFSVAKHKGVSPKTLDSYLADTFTNMDSSSVDSAGTDGFYFYLAQESAFQNFFNGPTLYYVLRIFGHSAYVAKIWIVEERIDKY